MGLNNCFGHKIEHYLVQYCAHFFSDHNHWFLSSVNHHCFVSQFVCVRMMCVFWSHYLCPNLYFVSNYSGDTRLHKILLSLVTKTVLVPFCVFVSTHFWWNSPMTAQVRFFSILCPVCKWCGHRTSVFVFPPPQWFLCLAVCFLICDLYPPTLVTHNSPPGAIQRPRSKYRNLCDKSRA